MNIIKNVSEGIYPYQKALWDKLANGGFKQGEIMLFSAGRQTSKSMLTMHMLKSRYYGTNLCKEIMLPMPEPKYKFSRAKWYEADYNWIHYDEIVAWCTQQFGPHPTQHDAWSRWYHRYEGRIYFRDEKDYIWFCLRWS